MNSVVHFELPFDDEERASNFYSEAFDWEINPVPESEYVLVHTGETDEDGKPKERNCINGGMLKRHPPVRSPIITISVDSIDEAAERIEEAGGQVISEKSEVGDMGWAAYFADSEGNVVGLWEEK